MAVLIGKALAYFDCKDCRSIGQKYTAFKIERILADFVQEQQLELLKFFKDRLVKLDIISNECISEEGMKSIIKNFNYA